MLTKFKVWIEENYEKIKNMGYELETIFYSHCDNSIRSIQLELDSEKSIARITMWDCGDCHLIIIDVVSESTIINQHLEIDDKCDLNIKFYDFLNNLN